MKNQNKKNVSAGNQWQVSGEEDLDASLEEELKIEDSPKSDNEDFSNAPESSQTTTQEKKQKDFHKNKDSNDREEKMSYLKAELLKIQNQIQQILHYLDKNGISWEEPFPEKVSLQESHQLKETKTKEGQKYIEGVFTGEEMIGPDGKRYSVPSNYASKSKLVEGDILKLIIDPDGTFIYKQIGPVERERLVGTLVENEVSGQFYALVDGKRWKLLRASVTYFKGKAGDEVVILVPKNMKSSWAAVENIISKS